MNTYLDTDGDDTESMPMCLYMENEENRYFEVKKSDVLKKMRSRKNFYLDIDGSLIYDGLHDFGKPAPYLKEFLQALNNSDYEVYWLTTHCHDGDLTHLQEYLQRFLPEDVYALTVGYRPTVWGKQKTDAIDFSKDFLWLDDDASLQEQEILYTNKAEHKLIEIDLRKNNHQLKDIVYSGVLGNQLSA